MILSEALGEIKTIFLDTAPVIYSEVVFPPYPSAILPGIDKAALLICEVKEKS